MTKRVALVGVCVLALLITNVSLVIGLTWPMSEFSIAKAGAFGDSFGWLNSVFSGLALLGVAWTLLHQQDELKDSRASSRLDRFEGTFFQLVTMLRRNLDEIRVPRPDGGEPIWGVEALSFYSKQVVERLREHEKWLRVPHGRLVYQGLLLKSVRFMPLQARYLGTLEAILELIDRDLADTNAKASYWRLLCSQLTSAECKYLLLLSLRGKADDRLSELIRSADPILRRIEAAGASEAQRALFKRLHGVNLAERKEKFIAVFDGKEYKGIRNKARRELGKLDSIS